MTRRLGSVYEDSLDGSTYTGPIRSKTPKLKRLPYSRATGISYGNSGSQNAEDERSVATVKQDAPTGAEEGLLGRVKNIVSWLIPGWLYSPQKASPPLHNFDKGAASSHADEGDGRGERWPRPSLLGGRQQASQSHQMIPSTPPNLRDNDHDGVEGASRTDSMVMTMETTPLSDDLLGELLADVRADRTLVYSRLAQYFRLRRVGGSLLTREEFEKLAMLIQRQALPKRPPLSSRRRAPSATPRRSPRRTPSTHDDAAMEVEVSVAAPVPLEEPKEEEEELEKSRSGGMVGGQLPAGAFARHSLRPALRKSRVFSARFDDADEAELMAFTEQRRQQQQQQQSSSQLSIASGFSTVSEARRRLVEEARQRVAEQIRLAQQPTTEVRTFQSGFIDMLINPIGSSSGRCRVANCDGCPDFCE